jgi:transcriptional regulator of acetoin/glycerol metabolism
MMPTYPSAIAYILGWMTEDRETLDSSEIRDSSRGAPVPGLLLVFSERQPRLSPVPLTDAQVVLGRGEHGGVALTDTRISRQHAAVRLDGARFEVRDLGGRNGTFIDGEPAAPQVWTVAHALIRMGDSLFLPCADLRPYIGAEVVCQADGRVLGPVSQAVAAAITRAAQFGAGLHITGESGVGKEGAARLFHAAGGRPRGPFIAVNCASIPEGIAERLLFGARKGAFSGAVSDAEGYVQAADGGTLFLDEVADLDLLIQAKLLRVLESREVTALGATRPRPVDLRIVSATHKDLRAEVQAGRLREDLYFRIGRPEVTLPPLRERREELPWLVDVALQQIAGAPRPAVSLIETCLLRRWPGNIRELLTEIRVAAHDALAVGATRIEAGHLGRRAGLEFGAPPATHDPAPATPPKPNPIALPEDPRSPAARPILQALLRRVGGNVSKAARLLRMHRTQLRRLLAHHGIDADDDAT